MKFETASHQGLRRSERLRYRAMRPTFFSLPLEVRQEIYFLIFLDPDLRKGSGLLEMDKCDEFTRIHFASRMMFGFKMYCPHRHGSPGPCTYHTWWGGKVFASILRTSKQIYHEANSVLYSRFIFCMLPTQPLNGIGPQIRSWISNISLPFTINMASANVFRHVGRLYINEAAQNRSHVYAMLKETRRMLPGLKRWHAMVNFDPDNSPPERCEDEEWRDTAKELKQIFDGLQVVVLRYDPWGNWKVLEDPEDKEPHNLRFRRARKLNEYLIEEGIPNVQLTPNELFRHDGYLYDDNREDEISRNFDFWP